MYSGKSCSTKKQQPSKTFIKKINSIQLEEFQSLLHEVNHSYDDPLETIDMNSGDTSDWINEIVNEAKEWIEKYNDCNRDNSLQNHEFAEHFIRLCKLLPLRLLATK